MPNGPGLMWTVDKLLMLLFTFAIKNNQLHTCRFISESFGASQISWELLKGKFSWFFFFFFLHFYCFKNMSSCTGVIGVTQVNVGHSACLWQRQNQTNDEWSWWYSCTSYHSKNAHFGCLDPHFLQIRHQKSQTELANSALFLDWGKYKKKKKN